MVCGKGYDGFPSPERNWAGVGVQPGLRSACVSWCGGPLPPPPPEARLPYHTAPYWGQGELVGQLCQGWDGKISPLGNPSLLKMVYKGWEVRVGPPRPVSWGESQGSREGDSWGLCPEGARGLCMEGKDWPPRIQ